MPDELTPLEWLRLALIELEESRRVVACRPEFEAGVRALVAELGAGELIEVRPTPNLPDGTAALIFDPNAIEAATRQALQRAEQVRVALRREAFERELRRDYLWAASLNYPSNPRSAVIITGI